jgi:alpha-L-fucosidase
MGQDSETKRPYEPTRQSLSQHEAPEWFGDAKLGIFIHWGLYSVPAWAPASPGSLGEIQAKKWFANNPYAEWYLNSLRIDGSATQEYHDSTYGQEVDYYDFASTFNDEIRNWNPQRMARLFDQVGARYVVLVTKHHDGFTLWPSRVENPNLPPAHQGAKRDIVGDLAEAVREEGLRYGLYYSGGIDWSFKGTTVTNMQRLIAAVPTSEEYVTYADAHWRELIERYEPSVLWNDIAYPSAEKRRQLFADYYNRNPEGVINNRWGTPGELKKAFEEGAGMEGLNVPADFTTPEYAQYDEITPKKWEATRGIGHSFGYNRNEGSEDMLSVDELVDSFVDIVSKNGNLLLNVGPKADGTIPDVQVDRLRGLGQWLNTNGEAIFGSRPWTVAEDTTRAGVPLRYTRKGEAVYAILLDTPSEGRVAIEGLRAESDTEIRLLGHRSPLTWEQSGGRLTIELPANVEESVAHTLRIHPPPTRSEK